MIKKITSFIYHFTAEGERLSYTYSEIDDNGKVTKSNAKGSIIILDDEISKKLKEVEKFLYEKIKE